MIPIEKMKVGEIFRNAREEQELSEQEAASAIQISTRMLLALERGEKKYLPAPVYVTGFFKRYAAYLRIPEEEYREVMLEEWGIDKEKINASVFSKTEKRSFLSFLNYHRIILLIFGVVFLSISGYFIYQFRFWIGKPSLVIDSPPHELSTTERIIFVSGATESSAELFLNGRQLPVDKDGNFKDTALLQKGLNTFEFEAKNRLGKIKKDTRYVFVTSD